VANYGQSSVIVAFDNSGGTPVTMTTYVQTINGVDVESLMEQSDSFGDSWLEFLPVGVRKVSGDIVLEGLYDDTATTGPDAVFNAPAPTVATSSRTLTLTFGGSKTFAVETYIKKYSRMLVRGKLHRYSVTLQPTAAVTEA
jgi:hypothetical protein